MGTSEDPKGLSLPVDDKANVHVYSDWAALQAYYSPRFVVPQFFGANVVSGHTTPPYIWGPLQHMMPPYVPPYATIYSHGGVYANPGVPPAPFVNAETLSKSSVDIEQSLMKKLKGFDGLARSTGNSNANNGDGGANLTDSQSSETDKSTDGSNSNTDKSSDRNAQKRYHNCEKPTIDEDGNNGTQPSLSPDGKESDALGGNIKSLEFRNPSGMLMKSIEMPNESCLKNEREMKMQRRKQSNRESARRSRIKKQAETDELAKRVDALASENLSLRSEMIHLTEISEKMKLENAALSSHIEVIGVDKSIVEKTSKFDATIPQRTQEGFVSLSSSS